MDYYDVLSDIVVNKLTSDVVRRAMNITGNLDWELYLTLKRCWRYLLTKPDTWILGYAR